jgi:hypothetical protein
MTNPGMRLLVSSVISQRKAVARMLDFAKEVIGGRPPFYISFSVFGRGTRRGADGNSPRLFFTGR